MTTHLSEPRLERMFGRDVGGKAASTKAHSVVETESVGRVGDRDGAAAVGGGDDGE